MISFCNLLMASAIGCHVRLLSSSLVNSLHLSLPYWCVYAYSEMTERRVGLNKQNVTFWVNWRVVYIMLEPYLWIWLYASLFAPYMVKLVVANFRLCTSTPSGARQELVVWFYNQLITITVLVFSFAIDKDIMLSDLILPASGHHRDVLFKTKYQQALILARANSK